MDDWALRLVCSNRRSAGGTAAHRVEQFACRKWLFRSAMLCAAGNDSSSLLIILSINAFRSDSAVVHVLKRAAAGGASSGPRTRRPLRGEPNGTVQSRSGHKTDRLPRGAQFPLRPFQAAKARRQNATASVAVRMLSAARACSGCSYGGSRSRTRGVIARTTAHGANRKPTTSQASFRSAPTAAIRLMVFQTASFDPKQSSKSRLSRGR